MQLGVAHYVFFERLLKDDRFVSGLEAVIISAGDIVAAKFYCLVEKGEQNRAVLEFLKVSFPRVERELQFSSSPFRFCAAT